MKLKLIREEYTKEATIGRLFIDDVFFCYTLEDAVRDKKIKNITAIPSGSYKVIIDFSNRFQQLMPLLLNVSNYLGVRIHWGNYAKDTEGCILVGNKKGVDFIGNSKQCYSVLIAKMKKAIQTESISIEIVDTKKPVTKPVSETESK